MIVREDQASAPLYVSGIDWGMPGFGDTRISKSQWRSQGCVGKRDIKQNWD